MVGVISSFVLVHFTEATATQQSFLKVSFNECVIILPGRTTLPPVLPVLVKYARLQTCFSKEEPTNESSGIREQCARVYALCAV